MITSEALELSNGMHHGALLSNVVSLQTLRVLMSSPNVKWSLTSYGKMTDSCCHWLSLELAWILTNLLNMSKMVAMR